MNILFYTRFFPDPTFGGIERVSSVLASQFQREYGCNVYCVVPQRQRQDKPHTFNEIFYIDPRRAREQLRQIIADYRIQVIVSQYANDSLNSVFSEVKQETGCKLITVYHFSPGCEMLSLKESLRPTAHPRGWKNRLKHLAKIILQPAYLGYHDRKINRAIRSAYAGSDRYLLLSDRFKSDFLKTYRIPDDGSKISSIGNPLSFPILDVPFEELMAGKKKDVLIVARHNETQKKIYSALDIWRRIGQTENMTGLQDWRLVLVGEGPDTTGYKKYVCEHRLANVTFVGKQDPGPYYRAASLFMMTSRYEGFGVTLTEALQIGVVPIAFDSYAALHDIITDRDNGIIVPNNDIDAYTKELVALMRDETGRQSMVGDGLLSCRKFSVENISAQWMALFRETITEIK